MSEDFKRQIRYIVLKNNDVSRALDADQHRELLALCAVVSEQREIEGKQPMQCVVVESDWSIYEEVWKLVELEAQGAEQPASEDAWLDDVINDVVTLCELHSRAVRYQTETLHSALMERREKLKDRLRARPAREGFMSVPVEPPRLTDEDLRKIAHLEQFLLFCDQDEFNDIARHIEDVVLRRLIAAAKGDGK